jgi:Cytochrome c554 and c-prime
MTRKRYSRWLISATILLLSGWLGVAAWFVFQTFLPSTEKNPPSLPPAPPATPKNGAPGKEAVGAHFLGVASCATQACHHANGPTGAMGSEYSTWMAHDKHARAFRVLQDERSQRIEANLKNLGDRREAHPEKNSLCLSCHVGPEGLAATHRPRFSLADGVGCENCHGGAEKWLEPHVKWSGLPPEERKRQYDDHKMTWLRDPATRIKVCVPCHVGVPGQEVDHDLIAAGHPRLNFEFSAYQAATPRHWPVRQDRPPIGEARAWAVGQVVCARAALDLLAGHARTPGRAWPEFSDFNCFACHHGLQGPKVRPPEGRVGEAGFLRWNDWYVAALPRALALRKPKMQVNALAELRKEISKRAPQPSKFADLARSAATELDAWLAEADRGSFDDPESLQQMLTALREDGKGPAPSWESATQRYLGMNALLRTLEELRPAQSQAQFRTYLQELGRNLQFPPGFDSPRDFVPKD